MALLAPLKNGTAATAREVHDLPANDSGWSFLAGKLETIDIRNMWRTLWRWRSLVLWTTVIITAVAVVAIYRIMPQYSGSAQVMVGVRQVKINSIQDILSELKGDEVTEMVGTEIGLIRSRNLAEKVVNKLNLANDPEFNPALRQAGMLSQLFHSQTAAAQAWLGRLLGAGGKETADQAGSDAEMNKIIDAFEEKLKVTNDGKSRIINISFDSKNPAVAAQVANAVAAAYIVSRLDAKFDATKHANEWLAERLNTLRQEVQISEDAVEKFRAENGLLRAQGPAGPADLGGGTTLAMQQMAQVSAEAVTAHTKFLDAQSRLAQLQRSGVTKGHNAEAAVRDASLLEVLQSPVIQNLRAQEADAQRREADLLSQFGDRYPKVINVRAEIAEIRGKIQTEVDRVIDSLKTEIANQQSKEQSLNTLLAKMKNDAARNDIAEVQLRDLERQAQANRTLYQNFLADYKQTQSQDNFQQPDADVVSRAAVPSEPSYPHKSVLILLSAVASFIVGTLLALACENLDVAIRSMDQVRSQLKVHPLGMVPSLGGVRRTTGARPEHEVIDHPLSAYAEAIRTIHTNLMLSDVDQRPRVVLVTSALPGEGKSTMAMSLAQMVAGYGQRVVVIDGDLRRPAVHRLAGVSHKPGLVEWLLGRAALEEVIYPTGPGGLDVIPAGAQPELPPNLLSSDRFKQLLRGLMERYDMVILDSAPVLAVSDTRILATLAEKTLFVVRWASTSHKVAGSALRQLIESGAQVAGVALMAVDIKAHAKDGFTDSVLYAGRLREYYR
jgi:succinoglycan biosynthesis transport protein ExoP